MILSTTYATGQVPFKDVYLHGLVRAEDGRKMSKSDPETMIDPMEVIPEFGADALRLALVSGVNAGQDQRLGRSKIVDNRNFCNKLWNVSRYIEMTVGDATAKASPKTPADHWILNKLSILTGKQWGNLNDFRFSEAYQDLYHFVWDDLADWYVEASKVEPNHGLLNYILENTLVLAHPFAPFISEAIWRQLGHEDLLATQLFPKVDQVDAAQAAKFDELQKVIAQARHLMAVTGAKKPTLYYKNSPLLEEQAGLVERLARLGGISQAADADGLKLIGTTDEIRLGIDKSAAQAYIDKLTQQRQQRRETISRLEQRLANKRYVDNAPPELVEDTKASLSAEQNLASDLDTEIASFQESLS